MFSLNHPDTMAEEEVTAIQNEGDAEEEDEDIENGDAEVTGLSFPAHSHCLIFKSEKREAIEG